MVEISIENSDMGPRYLSLFVDGEEERVLYHPFFKRHIKKLLQASDRKVLQIIIEKIELDRGTSFSIWALGRKSHTSFELRSKLEKRKISSPIIDKIMTKMIDSGYINDHEEINRIIRSEMIKGRGPFRVLQKAQLRSRMDRDVLQERIRDVLPKEKELELIQKKFKKVPKDHKERSKVYRQLASRGFSSEAILEFMASSQHAPDI